MLTEYDSYIFSKILILLINNIFKLFMYKIPYFHQIDEFQIQKDYFDDLNKIEDDLEIKYYKSEKVSMEYINSIERKIENDKIPNIICTHLKNDINNVILRIKNRVRLTLKRQTSQY